MQILSELFNNKEIQNKNLFKVNSLMNIFNIFELLCWDKIKENLVEEYKMKLSESIIKKFDSFYSNEENKRYITKIKLATALRRFISRYLAGKRNQNEFNEKNNLMLYLPKEELWDEYDFTSSEEFNKELNELFSDNDNDCLIMVGHSLELYDYLGGDKSLLDKYFDGLDIQKEENKNEINHEIKLIDEVNINNININNENYFDLDFVKENPKDINDISKNKNEENSIKNEYNLDDIIDEQQKNSNNNEIEKEEEKNQDEDDEDGEDEGDDFLQNDDNEDENIEKDQDIYY